MKVRPATEADVDEWVRMRHALWPDQTPADLRADWSDFADQSRWVVLVAEAGGKIVGFAEAHVREYANSSATRPCAFLEGIWVEPAARRAGVGRDLVAGVEAWARGLGLRELGSDALLDNAASHRAHAGWGFAEVERVVYFNKPLS